MPTSTEAQGFAVTDKNDYKHVKQISYELKTAGEYDVDIEIKACGICGSDCATISGEWGEPNVPVVVGHEIVGLVSNVGDSVTKFKKGDRVGVGAQVWACLECDVCQSGEETYCPHQVGTYNDKYKDESVAQGGYANRVRVHEYFVFQIPENIPTDIAAPMLCAGITTYAPLRQNYKKNSKVGIVGVGGLGHFAIMWAKALGYEVHVFSRGTKKEDDAKKLGADFYHDSDAELSKDIAFSLDLIVSTAKVNSIPINKFLGTLKVHGKFISLGLPAEPFELTAMDFARNGIYFGSSHLGNRQEMEEMLDLASKQNIKTWIEKIPISKEGVEEGLRKVFENDVRYRVVLTDYEKIFNSNQV